MSGIIYRITNTVNEKCYVGMTKRTLYERWSDHVYQASRVKKYYHYLHNAIRKYGKDVFVCEVLEQTTIDMMPTREMYWIEKLAPEYNMTQGGDGVIKPSLESKEKRASKLRGRPLSAEHRAKLSAALKNRKKDASTRQKMKDMSSRRPNKYYENFRLAQKGKTFTEEHCSKLSAAHKGKRLSSEHRANISAGMRRRLMETTVLSDAPSSPK